MMKCEWILCPVCGSKTRNKIRKDTVLENYPLYCPKCEKELKSYVKKYCKYFDADFEEIMAKPFKKLVPATSRPYANLYTPN